MPRSTGQAATVPGLENAQDDTPKQPQGDRVFLTFKGKHYMIPLDQAERGPRIEFNNWTYRTAKPAEIEYLTNRAQVRQDIIEIAADKQQEIIGMINRGEVTPKMAFKLMKV